MRGMKTEIQRDLNHSLFLVWTEAGARESYQMRMLTENKIPGLLSCQCRPLDDQLQMCFDITSLFPLAELAENKKLRSGALLTLVRSLCLAAEGLEDFLLKPEHLSLRPDHIFADTEIEHIYFCYLPEGEKNTGEAFRELSEYLLPRLDHQDPQGVSLGYGIYRYCMEEEFRIDTLKQTVQSILEQHSKTPGTKWKPEEEELWEEEEERVRRIRHEEALEAFFGEEPEEEQERWEGKWKIAAAGGSLLIYLGAGYLLWKNRSLYLGIWGVAGIVGAVAAAIYFFLWNRRQGKEEEKREEGQERQKQHEGIQRVQGKEYKESGRKEEEGQYKNRREKEKYAGDEAEKTGEKWGIRQYGGNEQENRRPEGWGKQMREEYGRAWGENGQRREDELMGIDETDVLNPEAERKKYCLRGIGSMEGKDRIFRLEDQKVHIVGKLKGTADLLIFSPTVSRIHARIRKAGSHWLVKDMNSKNGTYVNGKRILGEQEMELKEGDQVRFAEKSYVFDRE